jgi:predicted transposase YbfD/YdcC
LDCLEVTPTQVGFPGARMVASLESRTHRDGNWHTERVFLISSRSLGELQAEGMLALKRRYWVIENRLHHCLDITLREDWSRVRNPNSARILGMIRRLIVSLANAAVNRARKRRPKTKANTKSFRKRFLSARGGRQRLHALVFDKHPQLLDL